MYNNKIALPDTLSAIIRVAVEDIKSLPENVEVYMENFIGKNAEGSVCSVCLAGAVMLNRGSSEYITGYCTDTSRKLVALDAIRGLRLLGALSSIVGRENVSIETVVRFNKFVETTPTVRPLTGHVSASVVVEVMTEVANWLEENGL